MDIFSDKKLIIGAMLSVAILFSVFLIAGYINLPFYNSIREGEIGPGSCLVLEEKYCETARLYVIDASGTEAAVFNLPDNTRLYMPFDGAYFNDSLSEEGTDRVRLGIPDSDVFIVIKGTQNPDVADGTKVAKGALVSTVEDDSSASEDPTDFNIIIYGENYEIADLF